ncbi:MAG: flippase-like domain-containing protein [Deltaproteobacteria bacterium]|nr:flippase-like domain-containing protein [Deltaproteobacteria bacterium]MBI3389632.1 flippase-like domain-containing protein [Deltaproteobacteria bacterium]
MSVASVVKSAAKLAVTVGIFVAIFVEIGGGYRPVPVVEIDRPGTFEAANPQYPGIVGRITARLTGRTLPPARVTVSLADVCDASADRTVFVRIAGVAQPFKALRHCTDGRLARVFVLRDGEFVVVPLVDAGDSAYFSIQGFQLVPIDLVDLWHAVRALDMAVFLPWFALAIVVKLAGIFANVWRWQILLQGQGIQLSFGYLNRTYFIGRYFGIVTPSTMGLDGWRLYDTIRVTRKPIECTTALAVERVIGLVALFVVILLFMPFAAAVTHGQSLGELIGAMKIPFAGAIVFALLVLLQPTWFRGLLNLVPSARARRFLSGVIDAATAYATRRRYLVAALALAVFGQVTTTLMYFCNALAIRTGNVKPLEVLFASAVMTLGTFVLPSASGEGVREVVFVWLLGSKAGAVKAFLIGHLGFWIEKVPLSIPGGVWLLLRREPVKAVTRADLERLKAETT